MRVLSMQLGAMTRKITRAGRWNYLEACARETPGAPERNSLTLPTHGVDSVPTQDHGTGNLSSLLALLACRTTTDNLMLASNDEETTQEPSHLLPVDSHSHGTEQTLPQALSSSLGCRGDNLPVPKAKPQKETEMPTSYHATQPA